MCALAIRHGKRGHMRRRSLFLACAAAALAAPAAAQNSTTQLNPVPQQSTPTGAEAATETDIEFRTDAHQRMTVPVQLADAGPFHFLVDTGADRTSISRELVDALKLRSAGTAQLHTIAGSGTVETATIAGLRFSADPVREFAGPILERRNMGADGILGLDSLRSQRIFFDFRRNRMSILPALKRRVWDAPGTIVVRAKERGGRLILSRAWADGVPVTLVIDTGSEVTIGNAALQQRLRSKKTAQSDQAVMLRSVTGQLLAGKYTSLRMLEFGGTGLASLPVVFADAHTFRQLGLDASPAILLGMDAMRAFESVSIDFAQKKLRMKMPRNSATADIDVRRLGL
jgi:predicted aspartyl protease